MADIRAPRGASEKWVRSNGGPGPYPFVPQGNRRAVRGTCRSVGPAQRPRRTGRTMGVPGRKRKTGGRVHIRGEEPREEVQACLPKTATRRDAERCRSPPFSCSSFPARATRRIRRRRHPSGRRRQPTDPVAGRSSAGWRPASPATPGAHVRPRCASNPWSARKAFAFGRHRPDRRHRNDSARDKRGNGRDELLGELRLRVVRGLRRERRLRLRDGPSLRDPRTFVGADVM
jgi:hypothetical protein